MSKISPGLMSLPGGFVGSSQPLARTPGSTASAGSQGAGKGPLHILCREKSVCWGRWRWEGAMGVNPWGRSSSVQPDSSGMSWSGDVPRRRSTSPLPAGGSSALCALVIFSLVSS